VFRSANETDRLHVRFLRLNERYAAGLHMKITSVAHDLQGYPGTQGKDSSFAPKRFAQLSIGQIIRTSPAIEKRAIYKGSMA
jgi:hypothetical protein